jgi:hypothetical protein
MANATILYACTSGGLAIVNKPGTLNEWLPARMSLAGQAVAAAWAEPGPPIRVVVAAMDATRAGGVFLSENGGRDWESKLEAPVTALLGVETEGSPATLYAGMDGGGLAASVDGGLDWGILPGIEDAPGAIRRLLYPGEPGVFYAIVESPGEGRALLEGNPNEGGWRVLPPGNVSGLSWDTETGDLYAVSPEGVLMSADQGATWPALPGSPEGCTNIVVIPGPAGANPSILVSTESALLASNDAGASWHELPFPQPGITAFARDPERRDRLYAATASGHLFESGNRGQLWMPVNSEPMAPIASVYVIRI